MAVNVKMGVDIGGFTSGIKQGQQILKGLNAEMKASEAEFKATGNAEQKAASQTKTLNSQLNVQRGIADQAKQALQAMTDAGINPADAAYQKLYVQMLNAEAGANEALAALNALGGGTAEAAEGADKLSGSLEGISKKMSLEQVRDGIGSITDGLEAAAQKAIEFGQRLWDSIMDSARRADDTATMAQMYGIDLQRFKQMQALVAGGMDTTVDAMLTAQDKLKKGIGSGSQEVMDDLQQLGLAFSSGKSETAQLITEDSLELFWEAGKALMAMDDAFDKEATAQRLFGRSWKELVPLFESYGSLDEYNAALDATAVSSEDATKNAADLADRVASLENTWTQLKDEVVGAVAPALTDAMKTLEGLLARVLEYMQTPEGKKALEDLGTAVSGLFDDLKKIDPEEVVAGFTSVFNTVVSSVQWLTENWESVVTAMKSILAGWTVLKVTGGVLDIVRIVSGMTALSGASAAAAGTAAGSSWGAAFGAAAMKASPFLAFLYTLLNPSAGGDEIGNNTLVDENENLTKEAQEYNFKQDETGDLYQDRTKLLEQAAQEAWDLYRTNQMDKAALEELRAKVMNDAAFKDLVNQFYETSRGNKDWKEIEDIDLSEWAKKYGTPQLPVDVVPPSDAAKVISEQIGTVKINGVVYVGDEQVGVEKTRKRFKIPGEANGLWSVPYDGYLARLHKGERVMPAREVSARNYSSNLYVESMYMNNGTDAAGLAAAMAAAQRRTMSGYGS